LAKLQSGNNRQQSILFSRAKDRLLPSGDAPWLASQRGERVMRNDDLASWRETADGSP
jgi:hypothetical protein